MTEPTEADVPEDARRFRVVVNAEGQYSIWYADSEIPAGWLSVGEPGDKTACLDEIERLWVDMRPRSVRAGAAGPPRPEDAELFLDG